MNYVGPGALAWAGEQSSPAITGSFATACAKPGWAGDGACPYMGSGSPREFL